MPRPKRKSVKLDKGSIEEILQEILVLNKQLRDVNDNTDIQQVGKINNELLRIIDSSISKKLEIVKLQVSLVKTDSKSDTSTPELTDEDKELIEKMIKGSEEDKESGVIYDV